MYKDESRKTEWQRANRAERRASGLCVSCPSSARPGKATCPDCFSRDQKRNRAVYLKFADKIKKRSAQWYKDNPEQAKKSRQAYQSKYSRRLVIQRYGLSEEEFSAALAAQGNACAICGKSFGKGNPCIDHDHASTEVRGLLCTRCNLGVAFLDDVLWHANAELYLWKSRESAYYPESERKGDPLSAEGLPTAPNL